MFPKKILGITIGWKDLGKVSSEYINEDVVRVQTHNFCNTRLHIGRDGKYGLVFKFCPKCLEKKPEGEDF